MQEFSDLISDEEALSLYGFVYRVRFGILYSYIGSKSVVGGRNWKRYKTSCREVIKHWDSPDRTIKVLYLLGIDGTPPRTQLKRLHMIESSYIYLEAANTSIELINTTDAFRRHLPQLSVKPKHDKWVI